MKYWLLTTEYPPFYGGGISTYSYHTALMLAVMGHQVTVFINDDAVSDIDSGFQGKIRIVRFNPLRSRSDTFLGHVTNISYEFAQIVREFIGREGPPDVVEAQEYLGIGYFLLQYKRLLYDWCRHLPVVVTLHSPSFLYLEYNHVPTFKYPNYWIGEMERFCIQAADLVISPSHFLLASIRERFDVRNNSIRIIANPYQMENEEFETSPADGQIVFYGKLSAQKGTFRLLSYFKKLWDQGFDRHLFLIGGQGIVYHPEGRTMGDLVRKQYRHFIEKGSLVLEDKIPPSQIRQRLAAAAVVIVPSTVDNLPYVVFEMMEMGKIVLVSKQGGQAEVVQDGVNGFVFDHNDPESFPAKLNHILNLGAEERNVVGVRARNTIATLYNPERIYKLKTEALAGLIHKEIRPQIFPFIRTRSHVHHAGANEEAALLSIIVPYFNMGRYIDETILSIAASDYGNKEILIINDGSTDAFSMAKLDGFRNKDGIAVYDRPNSGLGATRNFGASVANGVYIAFLDADDKVAPQYFTKCIRVLSYYGNVHFVGCWTRYFENSKQTWPTFNPEPPIILYHNLVNSSALVYKKQSFLAAGRNDCQMPFTGLEDYDSVISMTAGGYAGTVLPEVLFHYRVRSHSMIRGISRVKKLFLSQYISNRHKDFYATFAAELFNLVNANGPGILLDNPTLDVQVSDRLPLLGKFSGRAIHFIKKNRVAKTIAYKLYRLINK